MKIAYTIAPGRGDIDLLLQQVAFELGIAGFQTCGTVQINSEDDCDGPCDMDVKILPNGPVMRISQSLGREAKGCRLDPDALETAVGLVSATLESGADVLIINKFGKHEASGRGFRVVIADAIVRDIPVLVGVNDLNLAAFREFVGDEAVALSPEPSALMRWLDDVLQPREAVA